MRWYKQKDKQLHFAAGAIIGLSAILLGWYAMLLVVAAGVGKELYDAKNKGTVEVADAVATGVGGLVVATLVQTVKALM